MVIQKKLFYVRRTIDLWIATLSLSWIIVSRLQVIHFVLLRKTVVHFFGVTSAFPRFTRSAYTKSAAMTYYSHRQQKKGCKCTLNIQLSQINLLSFLIIGYRPIMILFQKQLLLTQLTIELNLE